MRLQFDYDGGGPGKGGNASLFVNDEKVAEGRIDLTQAGMFSADETADVGIDLGTPVVEAIGAEAESRFNGTNSEHHGRNQVGMFCLSGCLGGVLTVTTRKYRCSLKARECWHLRLTSRRKINYR